MYMCHDVSDDDADDDDIVDTGSVSFILKQSLIYVNQNLFSSL